MKVVKAVKALQKTKSTLNKNSYVRSDNNIHDNIRNCIIILQILTISTFKWSAAIIVEIYYMILIRDKRI